MSEGTISDQRQDIERGMQYEQDTFANPDSNKLNQPNN